ncbi:MAG: LysM peptidoglycan-binding domain-containing protein, partial [Betaproteobacteria bacterium]
MITRPNALIQAACISLLLMLVPGTAAPQGQNEPAVEKPEKAAGEPTQQTPGSLTIPGGNTEQQVAAPKSGESQTPAPAQEPSGPAKEESTEYIIKKGDTLWDISNAFFKDPFLWPFIWKANPYISNPDLIYPGNKLAIPSLAPIERALEAPAEELAEKPEAKEGIAGAGVRPKAPPAVSEEGAPAEGRLILPEEAPIPAVDKYAMLSAGFVNDEERVGSIVGTEERGKTMLGYDDIVYVKMRSPETVNVGDKFLIYTPLGKVNHPKKFGSYGRL